MLTQVLMHAVIIFGPVDLQDRLVACMTTLLPMPVHHVLCQARIDVDARALGNSACDTLPAMKPGEYRPPQSSCIGDI